MKVLFSLGILIILAFSIFSCKSQKPIETATENTNISASQPSAQTTSNMDDSELIRMEKGACHGTCPIYELTIFNNGKCEFKGVRFCKKLGAFTANMSSFELDLLKQKIDLLDMDSYPEKYESMIVDFPSTEILFATDNGTKSVWWRDGAPGDLEEMAVILDKFRQELDWEVDVNAPLPAGTIENEMLVSLKDGIKAADFAKDYKAFDFAPLKQLIPNQNYWLFKFDTKKISGVEMLNLLNKSEKINNAAFNKELEQRH